jgi:hypothetical protein
MEAVVSWMEAVVSWMEAVLPSRKLSRLLTVAMSKQDFLARKVEFNFFIMVYESLFQMGDILAE